MAGVLELATFRDLKGNEQKFKVNCLTFSRKIVPLEYDSETSENDYPANMRPYHEVKPVFLGCGSGDLLAVWF